MRNKREIGITLIALVITIIILLILAGITISQLTNSGLFENSKLAKEKYENAKLLEDSILKQYENAINNGEIASDRNIDIQQLKNQIKQELMQEMLASTNISNDYSIDNKIVGTWIDGKTIYQKTITGLNISLSWSGTYHATATCTQLIENVDQFVYVYGLTSRAGLVPLMLNKNSSDSTKWNICSFNDVSLSGMIIQYTKSTPTSTE